MAPWDMKDAFFLIKIHADSKKYLWFIWNGNLYEFNNLPFGLNTAPYVLTKITKNLLTSLGFIINLEKYKIYHIKTKIENLFKSNAAILGNSHS